MITRTGREELMRMTVAVAVVALLVSSVACSPRDGTGRDAGPATAPVPVPAENLTWSDLDPDGAPGVQIATLWGNHQTGGFGAFFRLPAGFASPLHTHTHDMKLVIVSGTYLQSHDGAAEFRLGPGSYLLQPGGDYRHTTSCDAASDCVFFVESDGAFDFLPVAGAGTTASN
jgi:hypothetical protein